MPNIEVYSSEYCPFCRGARRLLDKKGVDYTLYSVDGDPTKRAEMIDRGGHYTVPQIFIDGRPVGGFDDIQALDLDGRLNALLGL